MDLDTAPQIRRPWWVAGHLTLLPWARGAMRLRVAGRHHLPERGTVLVVCNHVSQRDPVLLGVASLPRKTYYMAKIELFKIPIVRRIIYGLGAFPVDRGNADRRALRMARELLGRGEVVLMFPEGTRSKDGLLGPGLPGAGTLGLGTDVTVVPAATWGGQRLLGPVRVVFGPPLDLSDLTDGPRSARAQVAVDRMMAAIAALLPQAGGPTQETAARD